MGNAAFCDQCRCSCCHKQAESEIPDPYSAYASIYDYSPRTPMDLTVKRGDILEIINETEHWVYVRKLTVKSGRYSQVTDEKGYVPKQLIRPIHSLEAAPWYFENITKCMEAKRCLLREENGEGAFLVWRNTRKQHYFLTVRNGNFARHYRILESDGDCYLVKGMKFKNLSELVAAYSENANGLCTKLQKPCVMLDTPSIPTLSYASEWEVERSSLKKVKLLGKGEFGEVWEGLWNNTIPVAIKELMVVKSDILNEVMIMKNLNHERLLKLCAVCTKDEPFCIVTELMRNGSLSKYLQCHREQRDIEYSLMIDFAVQITEGMAYLQSQKIIHRDLRADNILLSEMKSCKIADFGLAQFTFAEEKRKEMDLKIPVKWMAPEIFLEREYTFKSDVWSFGILLTEIVTYGEEPYPGMDNKSCIRFILQGNLMPIPEGCHQALYEIMRLCWRTDSPKRPGFLELQAMLTSLIESQIEETFPAVE
uniref:Tyrosine-protein kinase n=1 Tax=Lepisosteus oculatus TaxID=7918 RepID=W5NJ97_LEPOC|nr:PREDICTED: tyrosine-protein kinase SRK3-like [Lepisosteus oculatus]